MHVHVHVHVVKEYNITDRCNTSRYVKGTIILGSILHVHVRIHVKRNIRI